MLSKIITGLLILGFVSTSQSGASEAKKNIKQKNSIVVLQTNQGNIELKLFPKVAPLAVENFVTLTKKGYYNGVIFHRVIKGFMIQGGDPTGTGMGGESIWHKDFDNEYAPNIVFDKPYLLAMANRGPNTNGSQFFITTAKTPHLNGGYTIFGEVVKGKDVVRKIENISTSRPGDMPLFKQVIKKAYVK
ncbi:MAG: peptidylprolyl isomerase [Epsilonproteobacteria bacterium]|nr:MAG: peptidylprolyl isomerase [Campylobacterota bacterium]